MLGSIQEKLTRVRPPRVKITYDVETGGAVEKEELPFIVGIFADLSKEPAEPLGPVKDRKMVEIDRDNFDKVLGSMGPQIKLSPIDNTLSGAGKLSGSLGFEKLGHFDPLAIVQRVPDLAAWYERRSRIRELQAKVESSDNLALALDKMVDTSASNTAGAATRGAMLEAFVTSRTDLPPKQQELEAAQATLKTKEDAIVAPKTAYEEALKDKADKADDLGEADKAVEDATKALAEASEEQTDAAKAALDAATQAQQTAKQAADTANAAFDTAKTALHTAQQEIDEAARQAGALSTELMELMVYPDSVAKHVKATNNATLLMLVSEGYMALRGARTLAGDELLHAWRLLGQFATDILDGLDNSSGQSTVQLIDDRVAEIDATLTKQVNAILHHPAFQELEATWRGLYYLVSHAETGSSLKLRVLNVAKQDLLDDLTKAVEFDQSAVFKMIYEAEYGTYGGDPYSLLIGDYEFGRNSQDIKLLNKMAEIAAASHAPFISSSHSSLFGLDDFATLAKPRDLAKIFEGAALAEWRKFRDSEDSRYVALTMPKALLRLPYGEETQPVDGLSFEEDVLDDVTENRGPVALRGQANMSRFLWGNSAYLLAERITNAFSLYSWTAAIRGVEGGGLINDLPAYTFKTNEGDMTMVCPTQVTITDRREKELNDLGFISLCHCKGSSNAAFFGGQTTNSPKKYIVDAANANARTSSMLPYMLAASRFAHYVKVIMRKKVGSFLTRANVENFLNAWIAQYVLLDDDAGQETKAAYPLRAASIEVTDDPASPGSYKATIFIKPHFQLEELTTSIRLVADLPS